MFNFDKGRVKVLMVKYNKVNATLSDSQLNKLKSAVKNQTGVTLNTQNV